MDKQDTMLLLGKMMDKKSVFIYTENSLLEFHPPNTEITFDKENLGLKTFHSDITLRYDSIQAIDFNNR